MKDRLQRLLERFDELQQRHPVLGFPYGVLKKFGDDQAGSLAGLLAYYAFLSVFPLLLVFTTIVGFVLKGNPSLEHSITHGVLSQFPIIGQTSEHEQLKGSGIALVIGLLGSLWGGLAIANAAQNAFNRVWEVPFVARPGFFPRILRSLTVLVFIGGGLIATTVISAISTGAGSYGLVLGTAARVGAAIAAFAVNVVIFILAFKTLTAKEHSIRELLPGAIIAAAGWQILQLLGGYFIAHQLKGASRTYGTFAVVIGLLAWFQIQAQITLYAAEVNVVKAHRLWPRAFLNPPKTDADRRALESYVQRMRFTQEQRVETTFTQDHGPPE
jgi:YihY family inner membrane protein